MLHETVAVIKGKPLQKEILAIGHHSDSDIISTTSLENDQDEDTLVQKEILSQPFWNTRQKVIYALQGLCP